MQREKSRTKNSIINVCTGLASQLLLTILQFVSRTIFIQTLGNSYLGINGLFSNILTMLSLTELGLDTAINFKLYKPLAERDTYRLQLLMKFYRDAYLVVGCIILVIGGILIPFLPALIKDYNSLHALGINPVIIYVMYLTQSAMSYFFFASKSAIIKADQKSYITTLISFFTNICLVIGQIIILVLYHDFLLYTALGLVATIVMNLISARAAQRMYPQVFHHTKEHLEITEIKNIFKDLGALFVYRVNNVVVKATDNIVISAFIGINSVGLYSNYLILYTTLNTILDRIYSAIKASMGNLFATESVEKKYSFFQIMNYLSAVVYGTAGVGIAVCADGLLVNWIGEKYVIAKPFSLLVGVEILFYGLKSNLGQIRNVSGIFKQLWYRPIIGTIINLCVSIWLIKRCGIYGVIIGTITADVLANFLVDPIVIHKYSFMNYKPVKEYYTTNVAYLLLLVCVFLIDSFICRIIGNNMGWLSTIIHILICGISVPFAFTTVFYRRNESKYLLHMFRSIIHRHR